MICTNCGRETPDTARVCGYCGHRLKEPGHAFTPPTTPAYYQQERKTRPLVWIAVAFIGFFCLGGLLLGAGLLMSQGFHVTVVNPTATVVFPTSNAFPSPTVQPTVTVSPVPAVSEITLTITNQDCRKQNVYLDDRLLTVVEKEATTSIKIAAGTHRYHSCDAAEGHTTDCSEQQTKGLISDDTITFGRPPQCPVNGKVTITLVNKHCYGTDYYVDGVKAASVKAESSATFTVPPGSHTTYTCNVGTSDCTPAQIKEWPLSVEQEISRGSYCP